jgi:hypothetical protein
MRTRGSGRADVARRTQTNEPARCATLLPALAQLPPPLALIEVGASAGLTLLTDRYSYDYARHRITGRDPLAPTLRCQPGGPVPLPDRVPEIAWRAGLDLNPSTSPAMTTSAGCRAWSGRAKATVRSGWPARSPRPAATRPSCTAVTCSPTCPRWPPRLPPTRPWSCTTRRCWPTSRRGTGAVRRHRPGPARGLLSSERPGVVPGLPSPPYEGAPFVLGRNGRTPPRPRRRPRNLAPLAPVSPALRGSGEPVPLTAPYRLSLLSSIDMAVSMWKGRGSRVRRWATGWPEVSHSLARGKGT